MSAAKSRLLYTAACLGFVSSKYIEDQPSFANTPDDVESTRILERYCAVMGEQILKVMSEHIDDIKIASLGWQYPATSDGKPMNDLFNTKTPYIEVVADLVRQTPEYIEAFENVKKIKSNWKEETHVPTDNFLDMMVDCEFDTELAVKPEELPLTAYLYWLGTQELPSNIFDSIHGSLAGMLIEWYRIKQNLERNDLYAAIRGGTDVVGYTDHDYMICETINGAAERKILGIFSDGDNIHWEEV